ncbi:MAG: IS21 family transposase [Coriobacteriia bacterium]|nr:MAG: IS21 family transposase [Coriobacteriia bacterium]PWL79925.1 MAG: IS21 family transposase [Coriobacteriia bacterium]
MISMSQAYSIRQLKKQGESITDIAEKTGVCRNTVYKYLKESDFSEPIPKKTDKVCMLDRYRAIIESWLDEDKRNWHKQKHTAHRIWMRLKEECGISCSESTVRNYVRRLKVERGEQNEQFLDLEWPPGEAQADFGEVDIFVLGQKRRLSYFVLSFPYSNMGFAQLFSSENAECVCQGLKNIFEFIGGVPSRIVFDNATGVGRRTMDAVKLTKLFSAFCAHYNFAYTFCNPDSGHEKGNVEGKVGFIRRNIFTPPPRIDNIDVYNERLLRKCMGLSKMHYAKGEPEDQLFIEDRFALSGLPEVSFSVVRYERRKADLQGKVTLCGNHKYSSSPEFAKQVLICALSANHIELYSEDGMFIVRHTRQYGDAPTDTSDPASQLPLLIRKPGG